MNNVSKRGFPRCRELRESAGLSMTKLAATAGVSRDLLRSLEEGNPHTAPKVMSVFNALQAAHTNSLVAEHEIVRHTDAKYKPDETGTKHGNH